MRVFKIDCGAPGNGALMNWVFFPASLICVYFVVCAPRIYPLNPCYGIYIVFTSNPDFLTQNFGSLIAPMIVIGMWIKRQFANHRTIELISNAIVFDQDFSSQLDGKLQQL